jgi:mono/diheme cytochrome c family protein
MPAAAYDTLGRADETRTFPETYRSMMSSGKLTALLAAFALGLSGCGGDDDDDSAATTGGGGNATGSEVFASAGCGTCHTLSAAGSSGTIGPNLDETQADEATVAEQVRNGGGGMPAFGDRLSDEEIQAVAAFVAESAGG